MVKLPHPDRVRTSALDFWLARSAIACVAGLQLLVVNDFSLGPRWLAPALELALLVPLSAATAWNQGRERHATTDAHWAEVHRHHRLIRRMAAILTALVTVANTAALAALVHALFKGKAGSGPTLLIDALNIWGTNVIIFALWFWTTDRGGAALRGHPSVRDPDFLFPQMTLGSAEAQAPFVPGFVDYLFLAFTNATAFSPTDTLPLTPRAKLLMMAEALISLLTVALVAARAVNILA
ncbi:hypothetical protein ASG32_29030 [Methylobacterium sp. Leaf361]|uniref:hypothetical protein n=1 Tax=Methylobacterium sp. Leaf361 TaxID=1736352 RepID=UPI0006FDEB56|nr:hypothetical protein [Methylobacterium sp. Leaf361]KQS71486.1 hypothetical protein ASG32_29030 [Methylobacterium sp. Leaf361]